MPASPTTAVEHAPEAGVGYDQPSGGQELAQQPLGITPEGLAYLQHYDRKRAADQAAEHEARVRYHQQQLLDARRQISQPMFGARGELPAYPQQRMDRQLASGSADGRATLPSAPHGRQQLLPPAPGASRGSQHPENTHPNAKKSGKGNQGHNTGTDKKTSSLMERFNSLSPTRRVTAGMAAGVVVIGGLVGLSKIPEQPGSTTAQIAKANQEYPAFKNDSFSCGAALAQVAFAGSMNIQLTVHLKEPGHTAYLPVAAYMGTDLTVGACGIPGKDGSAQTMATYNNKHYTADRAVLELSAPSSAFASQTCNPNEVKRICISMPKGFFVDGKKATIANAETKKGSGLFSVTTEDKKQFTVTATELSRINKLTLPPTGKAAPSKEYTQYLTAIATNMKFASLEALEDPAVCRPLQDTIDAAVSKAIIARNQAMNFKEAKDATTFKPSSKYGKMSIDFMNDKANKAILDPKSTGHIIDVDNFKPTCNVTPVGNDKAGAPAATKTANK